VIAIAAFLWLGTRLISPIASLSSYFAVMTVIATIVVAVPILFESAVWATLVEPSAGAMVVLLSERLVLGAIAVAFVAVLVFVGGRRGALYLRLSRTSSPTANDGARSRIRWSWAGPIAIVMLTVMTALAMAPALPSTVDLDVAAPFLVMAVLAAALNAFWEEAVFRAAPLGRLAPVIGPGPGVVILAAWFGLGHFYGGVPSGPIGAVMVTLVGLVLGRSMADTRGLAWPWAIHFSIDLTIYVVMALAAPVGA
jgi:membrane protease YdiL (CAAX protease family)